MDGATTSAAHIVSTQANVGPAPSAKVFVVHGRNLAARDAVATLLQRSHVVIISMEDAHGQAVKRMPNPSVQDIVLTGIEMADAVVVVLTGDDRAHVRSRFSRVAELGSDGSSALGLQPRQNVIYECGVVAGAQKPSAYVQIGRLRLPSDLQIWTLQYDGSPGATPGSLERVCRGLANALGIQLSIEDSDRVVVEEHFRAALRTTKTAPCELKIWCRRFAAVALGVLLTAGSVVASDIAALLGDHEFQWAGENWIGRVTIGWPNGQPGSASLVVNEFKKFVDTEGNTRFETRELLRSDRGKASWTGLGIELDLPINDERPDRASTGSRCTRIRFVPKPTLAFYGVAKYELENQQTHKGDLLLTQVFATLHTDREPADQDRN